MRILFRVLTIFIALTVATSALAQSHLDLIWSRTFGGSQFDGLGGIALSPTGQIYASGGTRSALDGPNMGSTDAYIASITPTGDLSWVRQFGTNTSESATDIAVDASGNIYSVGARWLYNYDTFVVKYSTDGTMIWTRDINHPGWDEGYSLAVKPDQTVVVGMAGDTSTDPIVGRSDAVVALFSPTGQIQPLRSWGTTGDEKIRDTAVDHQGNIYLAGFNEELINDQELEYPPINAIVVKFDPLGNHLWTRTLEAEGNDWAQAVNTGPNGELYIARMTTGDIGAANGGSSDAYMMRLDPDTGQTIWANQIGGEMRDGAWHIAVADSDDVYLLHSTEVFSDSEPGTTITTTASVLNKYDPDGELIWSEIIATNNQSLTSGLAVGENGEIYLVGETENTLSGDTDALIVKFLEVPEPSTLSLSFGVGLLLLRRRRAA
jgi:hypothetical protein